MSISEEIQNAVARLGLDQDDVKVVPFAEARALTEAMLARFTGGKDARWWWETFTLPYTATRFGDGKAFSRIEKIVPNAAERVWFVVEDDEAAAFPIYETSPTIARKIIGECYGFEYYLVAKDFAWLLCENHHDVMFAIGEGLGIRLVKAGAEQGGDLKR